MRIGIDCRLSGLAHAGIGRYIENLIQLLPQLAPEIDWVYFFYDHQQAQKYDFNAETHIVPIRHYTISEQVSLPKVFSQAKLDLLHVPHFNAPIAYKGPLVVTIHDLLWHQHRGQGVTTLTPGVYWLKYAAYRFVASRVVRTADQIIVPAYTIKQTLAQYYPQTETKTTVTYEGVDQQLLSHKQLKPVRQPHTLIYVGSLYPHKNITIVLQALQQLPKWQLIVTGSRNVFQKRVRAEVAERGIASQVRFTGYLPDEQLAQLIQATTALVQPSLSEGFGLTGLEALALHTPVVASDIPIFREIYQDAANYFNPHNTKELIAVLNSLPATPTATQLEVMDNCVSQYSWRQMAQQTLAVYHSTKSFKSE